MPLPLPLTAARSTRSSSLNARVEMSNGVSPSLSLSARPCSPRGVCSSSKAQTSRRSAAAARWSAVRPRFVRAIESTLQPPSRRSRTSGAAPASAAARKSVAPSG
eukprot:CAMPEP_0183367804 /NCGR_PEP_ID=MMETSP0164_2-20130417/93709_1 /TAXON_ID=221442 /ORGANISM="Coccolithus pelagicus ssp braarudi, Strain PLY182g" /LENGTH=104 /DNA_ID=CAMNT_0025543795 /DNA_START=51 /DNA_END=361 /DNA_ORIENTATION=+